MSIDTGKVKDRRKLRFESIADMRRDLDAIEQAHKKGTLRRSGNWTEGQIFSHLSAFMEYGYEGYPKGISMPWFIKLIFRPMRGKFLRDGFPAGKNIPGVQGGTIGMDDVPFEQGIARLRRALDRLEKECPPIESPAFGRMSHVDNIRLALRHGELHQSFLHPENP